MSRRDDFSTSRARSQSALPYPLEAGELLDARCPCGGLRDGSSTCQTVLPAHVGVPDADREFLHRPPLVSEALGSKEPRHDRQVDTHYRPNRNEFARNEMSPGTAGPVRAPMIAATKIARCTAVIA